MRLFPWLLAANFCVSVLNLTGCGHSTPTSPLAAGGGAGNPAASTSLWNGKIGLAAAGQTTAQGNVRTQFNRGEIVELQIDVGGAPAETSVNVTWLGLHGEILGQETRTTREGQELMSFASPSPGVLQPGRYQVNVSVDGRLVKEQRFEVRSLAPS